MTQETWIVLENNIIIDSETIDSPPRSDDESLSNDRYQFNMKIINKLRIRQKLPEGDYLGDSYTIYSGSNTYKIRQKVPSDNID